ncbi:MAG: ADP-ribosylglycohydrolase family protein [Eubacterium sp.]|nr:ADP-ribosylglycohydrolase family protein [Eubacterium sp.]
MRNEMYLEKIYAGLIGMDAGMRLGAPVESPYWTYEQLRDHYGDIRGYLRVHKNHPPDDDVNGPILLVRALTDRFLAGNAGECAGEDESCGRTYELTPEMAGEAWLNYTRFGKGMFWWGGEDVSTEHRAYMNLRRGVEPPRSGSAEQNGKTASEQIGGQIFVDTWGLIWPGNPRKAAEYAAAAASVSHDGNGIYGGRFMAACIAAAFAKQTVEEILDAGLAVIPEDCDYARVVRAVRQFHGAHPEDFRACRDYVVKEWGHDRFPGGWHIIPNAGICVTALLYGQGDLGRSVEIAVMCGFDTDCNASSVGTILGVLGGLEGIPERYREPINDTVLVSGCSGYLNMVDLPELANELCEIAGHLAMCQKEAAGSRGSGQGRAGSGSEENKKAAWPLKGELRFDFELPGSTHGLRLSDRSGHSIRNIEDPPGSGHRCLELMIDGKMPKPAELFFNGCYTADDLTEDRYDPAFSPRVYPGQTVTCRMKAVFPAPADLTVRPFLTRAMTGERIAFSPVRFSGAMTEAETLPAWDRQFDLQHVPDAVPESSPVCVYSAAEGMQQDAVLTDTGEAGQRAADHLPGNTWVELCFTVPELDGDQVHELGWQFDVKPAADEWAFDFVYIDAITVSGPMDYTIDFSVQKEEFGQITPFTFSDCTGTLAGDTLKICMPEEETACGCQAFTGNYYMRDTAVSVQTEVEEGESALVLLRGQGTRRYYALGFVRKGRAAILRWENGIVTELAAAPFAWERNIAYTLTAAAKGETLSLAVDGQTVLTAEDTHFSYGMAGLGAAAPGTVLWRRPRITGDLS